MVDMSAFIAAKSDQLNADDLMDAPRTITITKVTAAPDAAEQPVSIHYQNDGGKPWKPCKTCRRILVGVWGKDATKYVGRSLTLYRDPEVKFGGLQVGGIRVSHMSHIDGEKTLALMVKQGRKAPFKILPLKVKVQPADDQAVALKALEDAAEDGMDALANVWKQKWMAPHRDALQVDLDRLKVLAGAKAKPPEEPTVEEATADASKNGPASEQENADPVQGQPTTLGDQLALDEHPAQAKAAAIIAEIEEAGAILDITTILSREQTHIESFPDELGVKIEVAADKRKRAIEAARETAVAK